MTQTISHEGLPRLAPFFSAFVVPICVIMGAVHGGWWLASAPIFAWYLVSFADAFVGKNQENPDPQIGDEDLFGYRMLTLIWVPVQISLIIGMLIYLMATDHLAIYQEVIVMITLGIATGGIGINYSHELMHQKPKVERQGADLLLASVLYSHFRSEHLLVHHRYVGTPRDPVTARYNEGFHRFLPRVLVSCLLSSWKAEKAMLERKSLPWWDVRNPFWKYAILQVFFMTVAVLIGGGYGLILFAVQAFVAILHLELVNYVEHYGLTRKHLGDGKYEHVKPHHSWNTDFAVTNYLLINLQRHSDHHYKPDRRFPLLQTYSADEAPQLPFGYPMMTLAASIPPLWKRVMNKRVKAWRAQYYPEIEDWHPYNKALNPLPR